MSQERPLRVAVAGLGDVGRKHAAILAVHPAAELVAVVDRDQRALAGFRAEHHVPFGFDDVDILLMAHDIAAVELDLLVVCLPAAQHARVTRAARERDLRVLCGIPAGDARADAWTELL